MSTNQRTTQRTTKNLFFGKYAYCVVLQAYYLRFSAVRRALRTGSKIYLEAFCHEMVNLDKRYVFTPVDHQFLDRFFDFIVSLKPLKDQVRVVNSTPYFRIFYNGADLDQQIIHALSQFDSEQLIIREHFTPSESQLLETTAFEPSTLTRQRVVSRPNKFPYKMLISNIHHLVNETNVIEMIQNYKDAGLVDPKSLSILQHWTQYKSWNLKYAKSYVRVLDEETAMLLTLALGKKYVRHLVKEVCDYASSP